MMLDERDDLEDDEGEEFSELEAFCLHCIGQRRQEGREK